MNNNWFLGIVRNDKFKLLRSEKDLTAEPKDGHCRLTKIARQVAQTPESGEISLTLYNDNALMVRGIYDGGWIYSAVIVDQAGIILTAVVQEVFGQTKSR